MKKVLILVLSAFRDPWRDMMKRSRKTWDSVQNERTETIYYVGSSPVTRFEDRTLYSTTDEHLHNIGHRTVEALEFSLKHEWDYLARVHSSTYVHKRRMLEFVDTLPDLSVIYGLETPGPYGQSYLWGGGHYVIARGAVQEIVNNQEKWRHDWMEDVAMSHLARDIGIPFGIGRSTSIDWKPGLESASCIACNGRHGGFEFSDFKHLNKLDDQFFFRVKHDPDRSVDLRTMDLLFQNLEP